jgi:hypothetical protein
LLGNDVVDLADPEAAEAVLHPRFDARAFAAAERARLAASPERARLRWLLWAAKEAAWKAARRAGLALAFHPAEVETALAPAPGGAFEGFATLGGVAFVVRVDVAGDVVHALARARSLAPYRLVAALRRLPAAGPAAEAAGARALALDLASGALAAPRAELAVVRAARLPALRLGGAPVEAVLSLAHHGRFAAAALALPARSAPRAA